MDPAADAQMPVLDAIHSLRAVREYKTDPVPDEVLDRILRAGTMACSSGNTQPWEFLVLTDPALKAQIQEWMAEEMAKVNARRVQTQGQLIDGAGRSVTGHAAVRNLVNVPAIILVFWNPKRGIRFQNEYRELPDGSLEETVPSQDRGSSLFPCCQNMMLAAKALGLGSLFSTFFNKLRNKDIKQLLNVPPEVFLEAAVWIGYPNEKLGPPRRRPIEEMTHRNQWGTKYRG
jgi:nitroreductase